MFLCESSFTITLDKNRKCRTCYTDHLVFQGIRQGTVFLGDQYAPVMVGSNRKYIQVMRIVDATFKELSNCFANMIKSRAGTNDDSGENFSPGLVIVPLPGQVVNLGIEGYIQEFLIF